MSKQSQSSLVAQKQFVLFDPEKMFFDDEFEISVRDESAFCADREEFRAQMNTLEKLSNILSLRGYKCYQTRTAMAFETVWHFKKGGE